VAVVREAGSRGGGHFGDPEEGKRLPLEAATKQRLVKTEKTSCVMFGVCNSARLS
jgi:hypothetical protein